MSRRRRVPRRHDQPLVEPRAAFHQITGFADFAVEHAIELLRQAGHNDLAATLRTTRRLTTYYEPFREFERQARDLTDGLRHLYEAELKRRRTPDMAERPA